MKIAGITNKINFKAGKVNVYSDFDGTYCPAKHSSLHKEGENGFMKEYCSKMDKFFKSTEGDLHFHITTGRTFGEYEAVSYLLKMRGFQLPLPESFIAKNGSDEYIKNGTDSNFYQKGIFPYKYSEPNKVKESKIKNLTNWNGEKLKKFIRDLTVKYNLRLAEADSENSVSDYGENSLFSEGKLNADEWKKLPNKNGKISEHNVPIADYVIGARKDGNLKVNLIFSPDYGFCPERNIIYDNFMNEIKGYLEKEHIQYDMSWDAPSNHNHYRNHCNIAPKIEQSALTKVYDTKEALKNAIKNNDMVIVAGDGSNDFEMLNPLEYIEPEDWCKYEKNSQYKEFYNGSMEKKLSDLKAVTEGKNNKLKKELETNGFFKQLNEMPLYSIVIKKEKSKLTQLTDIFGTMGKVIEVENGELDKGIKKAVKYHSKNKKAFHDSMSENFKNFIFEKTKNSNKKGIIAATIIGIGVITLGILRIIKTNHSKK